MYNDITPEIRKKLPTYTVNVLIDIVQSLLQNHIWKRATGKWTTAQTAEEAAHLADWLGGAKKNILWQKAYNAWEWSWSQFHDILPELAHLKLMICMEMMSLLLQTDLPEFCKFMSTISKGLNTLGKGELLLFSIRFKRTGRFASVEMNIQSTCWNQGLWPEWEEVLSQT